MTPRRLRWDIHPNDHLNEPPLTEKWYQFFNKCKSDLLQTIIKRRKFKLQGVETHIVELQNSLLPFLSKPDYKDKETQLQESIKKYETEIQTKKQKKFKRDVLDYKNNKVYKWQAEEECPLELDEVSLEDSSSEDMEEIGNEDATYRPRLRFEAPSEPEPRTSSRHNY